jgi:hypothetical protein
MSATILELHVLSGAFSAFHHIEPYVYHSNTTSKKLKAGCTNLPMMTCNSKTT